MRAIFDFAARRLELEGDWESVAAVWESVQNLREQFTNVKISASCESQTADAKFVPKETDPACAKAFADGKFVLREGP